MCQLHLENCWKGQLGTNTLAYWAPRNLRRKHSVVSKATEYQWARSHKLFWSKFIPTF
jgi:hypothetical protein